jgi:hypothetical protein
MELSFILHRNLNSYWDKRLFFIVGVEHNELARNKAVIDSFI